MGAAPYGFDDCDDGFYFGGFFDEIEDAGLLEVFGIDVEIAGHKDNICFWVWEIFG